MKRFKKACRAIAFMLLMAISAVTMTGCDAASVLGVIQKILPVITQIIGAIKGTGTAGGTTSGTAKIASGTSTLGNVITAVSTVASSTATTGATVKEGDDAEGVPNSDTE